MLYNEVVAELKPFYVHRFSTVANKITRYLWESDNGSVIFPVFVARLRLHLREVCVPSDLLQLEVSTQAPYLMLINTVRTSEITSL